MLKLHAAHGPVFDELLARTKVASAPHSRQFGDKLRRVSSPADDEFDNDSTMVGGPEIATIGQRHFKRARLEQTQGPGAPRAFDLSLHETIVGRSTSAHICVDSSLISRKHMSLSKAGDLFSANDLNSSNGMYLNGVKVYSAVLHEGDQLQIGDVVFTFIEGN